MLEIIEEELITLSEDLEASALAAGLRHVSDDEPGIHRKPWGRGFTYIDPSGGHVTDLEQRERIEKLAIPPAWTNVWICVDEKGHIQATGRDEKGRKQYIYHHRWEELRNETKFNRMLLFGESLPRLHMQIDADLRRHGMPRERVVAAVVRLLQETLIRVGNPEYARNNHSYGLTTMRTRHLELHGTKLHFEFKGKSGKMHHVDVQDARVARVIKQCQELPGYELFQYVDEEGRRHQIESNDVNEYVRKATGRHFTAKDFRTWGGTVHAVRVLQRMGPAPDEHTAEKNVVQLYKEVAKQLGNTSAVCRQYYVHPAVIESYLNGTFFERCSEVEQLPDEEHLDFDEQVTLCILRHHLQESAGEPSS